jgi:hypothetical protein
MALTLEDIDKGEKAGVIPADRAASMRDAMGVSSAGASMSVPQAAPVAPPPVAAAAPPQEPKSLGERFSNWILPSGEGAKLSPAEAHAAMREQRSEFGPGTQVAASAPDYPVTRDKLISALSSHPKVTDADVAAVAAKPGNVPYASGMAPQGSPMLDAPGTVPGGPTVVPSVAPVPHSGGHGAPSAPAPGGVRMLPNGMVDPISAGNANDPRVQAANGQLQTNENLKGIQSQGADAQGLYTDAVKDGAAQQGAAFDQAGQQLSSNQNAYETQQNDLKTQVGKIQDEIRDTHIDGNRLMNTLPIPNKIALVMLSAVAGAASKGGPNPVLAQVNTIVQRDIDSQKDNLAKLQSEAAMKYRDMGINLTDKQAKDIAINAITENTYKKIQTGLTGAAATLDSTKAKLNAQQVSAVMDQAALDQRAGIQRSIMAEHAAAALAGAARKEAATQRDFTNGMEVAKLRQHDREIAVAEAKANGTSEADLQNKLASIDSYYDNAAKTQPTPGLGWLPTTDNRAFTANQAVGAAAITAKGETKPAAQEKFVDPLLVTPRDDANDIANKKRLARAKKINEVRNSPKGGPKAGADDLDSGEAE